jgi:RimJ/RimL family protein N-acetyltransferase
MALALVDQPFLTLTEIPTPEQTRSWWDEMWTDPEELKVAFSDLMPRSLSDFLANDILLVLVTDGSTCIAAVWLHDLEREWGHVVAGWVGGWVAPAFRGRSGCKAAQMAIDSFQARGIQHIYSAVNVANRASIALNGGRRMLGFTRVMNFPAFLPYGGRLTDCIIFTLHPEDVARARRAAAARVRKLRAAVTPRGPRSSYRPLVATQHDVGVLEHPLPPVLRGFGLAQRHPGWPTP